MGQAGWSRMACWRRTKVEAGAAALRRLTRLFSADGPPSDFPYPVGFGILLLALLVVASYSPALLAGFVWDDFIFTNARPVREWSGILDIWLDPKSLTPEAHYWPVTYTSFWLEHKLWGFAPAGYHAVNILLQLVNTLLVWRLMLRLAVPGACLVAAVFAAHPLHVESVVWIIARKDLLSGLLYLSAALVWLRFMEKPRWRHYFATLGLFVASLLSKTVTVTFPAALLVLYWWKRGRVTAADVLPLLPFFAVGFAIALGDTVRYSFLEPQDFGYSPVERLQIAAHALWFYAGKILWPAGLAVVYPFWEVGAGNLVEWGYVAAALALVAGLWLARDRIGRGPLAGFLFFLVTLSPVLGFVDYGYMRFSYVADRYQYLAGLGVLAVLVGAGVRAAARAPAAVRQKILAAAVLGVTALAGLSWKHSHIYRDEIVFFSHIIALNPDVQFAYSNLGLALQRFGDLEEAEKVFRRGLELDPRDKKVLHSLAEVVRLQGRHEESLQWYDAVLRRDRKYAKANVGKGDALFQLQRYDEAAAFLVGGLSLRPDMPQAPMIHTLIGEAAQKLGRFEEARRHFEAALRIMPDLARANSGLIDLLLEWQPAEETRRQLQVVRERYAGDAGGLYGIAEVFRQRKRYAEALAWYDATFEIDPDHAQAHAGRGDALFHLKRYEEAVRSLGRAVELEPENANARANLGVALYRTGRTGEAREALEHALSMDPSLAMAQTVLDLIRQDP